MGLPGLLEFKLHKFSCKIYFLKKTISQQDFLPLVTIKHTLETLLNYMKDYMQTEVKRVLCIQLIIQSDLHYFRVFLFF